MNVFNLISCDKITGDGIKYMREKMSMNLKNINSLRINHLEVEVNNKKRKAEEQIDKDKIFKKNKN